MTTTPVTTTDRRRLTTIHADRLFDGIHAKPLHDAMIVLDGPTIAAIDRRAHFAENPAMTVHDLPGATVLPGLIDTHFHLCLDASLTSVKSLAARDDEAALTAMSEAGHVALAAGITTIRDLGDRDYLSLQLRGRPDMPTIVAAGPPITSPGGHCHFLGGEASGVDGIRKAVDEHAERGVDVIKIMAGGGHLTPGSPAHLSQFSRPELAAAVDQAHRLGLAVTAHAHGLVTIEDALSAGVDGIEHVSFEIADGVAHAPSELVKALADAGVVLGLTLGIVAVPGLSMPSPLAANLSTVMANVQKLVDSGATVTLGTDAGIAPVKPHDVLPLAIVQFAGFCDDPARALRTATSEAAEAVGLGMSKGRLAAGWDADLLAVDGDPLTDLAALQQVRAVFAHGTLIAAV